jgi:hypothetical protein
MIAQNDVVGHFRIPQNEGFLGVSKRRFNIFADLPQPVTDVVKISLHAFFKMTHFKSSYSAISPGSRASRKAITNSRLSAINLNGGRITFIKNNALALAALDPVHIIANCACGFAIGIHE